MGPVARAACEVARSRPIGFSSPHSLYPSAAASGLSRREGARFLGVFKTFSDAGAFAGPLLAGSIAQLVGLDAACRAVGLVGLAGAAFYVVFGIETRSDASSPKLNATSGVADAGQVGMPAAISTAESKSTFGA